MSESSIDLPVGGRTYTVPSPPAAVGLSLQAAWTVSRALRAKKDPPAFAVERMARYDNGESDLDQDALGPVWDQMISDGVSVHDLRRAALAAYVWICTGSTSTALSVLDPEAEPGESGPKASTTTGAGDTTPPPASTSGTTSRRKRSPA